MDPELYHAAIDGSESFSEKIRAVDLNLQLTSQGNSILHIAAKSGREHIAEEILNKPELQSLMYKENFKGNTPLHIAARLGHFGLVKLLINRASEQELEACKELLRMVNLNKDTALHDAVRNGYFDIVELLIEEDPDLTLLTNSDGDSPLFLAVDREFYIIAQHILDKVPECSYEGRNSMNVLHAAVIRTPRKKKAQLPSAVLLITNLLIRNSENEQARNLSMTRADFLGKVLNNRQSAIKDADEFGWIPLHYAASLGSEEVVKLFMEVDTSYAYIKEKEGMSALHIASRFGNVDVSRTLIRICPDTSELLDNRGRTALHVAVENGKRNVVIFFLQTLAFQDLINEQDNEGNTPLHLSAIKRHYDLLILLADDRRVDKGAMNVAGMTTIDIIQPDKQLPVFQKRNIIEKLKRDNGLRSLVQVVQRELTLETNGQFEENERREPAAEAGVGMDAAKTVEENDVKYVSVGYFQYKDSDVMNMANVNLLVATIIATVTFQATFQMPGGYDLDGHPNLREKVLFKLFVAADSLAFSFSAAAIFANFFAACVPKSLGFTYPLILLFSLTGVSLACMTVAFVIGLRAVFRTNSVSSSLIYLVFFCFGLPIYYVLLKFIRLQNKFKYTQRTEGSSTAIGDVI